MHSDFSIMAKSARAALPVPGVPLGDIVNRSRALGNRGRLRMVVTSGALALAAVAGGTVGTKVYDGVQFWISGSRGTVMMHSLAITNSPTRRELRDLSARATFPVVYPVGMPKGTRLTGIIYAPTDHPTSITLQYANRRTGFNGSLSLVDPQAVNAANLPTSMGGRPPRFANASQWRVGGETVIAFREYISPADAQKIEDAMRSTTPASSLSANEGMLSTIRSLSGGPPANAADAIAGNRSAVLVGRGDLRLIPSLARAGGPLTGVTVRYISNIQYVKGVPDLGHASYRADRDVAVPADGVRAIAAVMAAAGESGRWTDCCEILYTPAENGSYILWTLPVTKLPHGEVELSKSQPIKKYVVDARTHRVRTM